ncbi:phosphoribosyl-ATP pyrophosphohydrolase/phosphoribosyl-AMP cyclohydrolase [Alkalihalobacillus xiaoxiensis]|uniref:Histidine biosynthesis bifunctional protein HisIE n=1 Tax=Shouchella xiaoxiensis TaxID=766895 RepID=A0ABS2SY68_9BACI|nr:bifunctional phosphoribosyl-AMP cyclohydrolase/phosphoribosyl-ATP diphosphatase HisIE [Shouchella xiaoxiensis]MBM7840475.1 phosphoribosyl-ATP pyrophosphohydrolase/phosphoribosyl-AMP cyclohydrolase [Shouchella xiaoxiensis]
MIDVTYNADGLIPVIVQDVTTKAVLTLAYMNETALNKTIETKQTWFYSRSRNELWHKGETSGNVQDVVEIMYDCDQDALLVYVHPHGPACHTGSISCFSQSLLEAGNQLASSPYAVLSNLEARIANRKKAMPEGAYTTYLFSEGLDKILKKVGEEASEVIIAAKNRDQDELSSETADLLYHLLVLLQEQETPLELILQKLSDRQK